MNHVYSDRSDSGNYIGNRTVFDTGFIPPVTLNRGNQRNICGSAYMYIIALKLFIYYIVS